MCTCSWVPTSRQSCRSRQTFPQPSRPPALPAPNEAAERGQDSSPQARSPSLAETAASSPSVPLPTVEAPSTSALPRRQLKRKAPATGFYASTECHEKTGTFQRTLHIYANFADAEEGQGSAKDDLQPVKLPGLVYEAMRRVFHRDWYAKARAKSLKNDDGGPRAGLSLSARRWVAAAQRQSQQSSPWRSATVFDLGRK